MLYLLLCEILNTKNKNKGMHCAETGETHYHAQLGLPDKRRAIIVLVVCNVCDLESLDVLNGLALGCHEPCPQVYLLFIDSVINWLSYYFLSLWNSFTF